MIKNIFTIWTFAIAFIVVVVSFITATTFLQLIVAITLYPLMVYIAYKAFLDHRSAVQEKKLVVVSDTSSKGAQATYSEQPANGDISDADKRIFLKLVGSTGVFLFIYSLLNISKKPSSILPKNLFQLGGGAPLGEITTPEVEKSQDQLIEGYKIAEIDNDTIAYYGFIDKHGAWYVMQADTTAGSFRYVRGEANFPENWKNRKNLAYDYLNKVF